MRLAVNHSLLLRSQLTCVQTCAHAHTHTHVYTRYMHLHTLTCPASAQSCPSFSSLALSVRPIPACPLSVHPPGPQALQRHPFSAHSAPSTPLKLSTRLRVRAGPGTDLQQVPWERVLRTACRQGCSPCLRAREQPDVLGRPDGPAGGLSTCLLHHHPHEGPAGLAGETRPACARDLLRVPRQHAAD